jgi:hypothetical protein
MLQCTHTQHNNKKKKTELIHDNLLGVVTGKGNKLGQANERDNSYLISITFCS